MDQEAQETRADEMNARELWIRTADENGTANQSSSAPLDGGRSDSEIDETTGYIEADVLIEKIADCILAIDRNRTASHRQHQQQNRRLQTMISPTRLLQAATGTPRRPALERGLAGRVESSDRLQEALSELAECTRLAYREKGLPAVNRIINKLAKVPLLIQTIVLLRDEDDYSTILRQPCVRRVLCCKQTVSTPSASTTEGNSTRSNQEQSWILNILRSKGSPASHQMRQRSRVVAYLETISSLTVLDYISVLVTEKDMESYELEVYHPDEEFIDAFCSERDELFEAISRYQMLIPYIFSLSNSLVERAALTPVVRAALHRAVQRPFMIAQVFLDLFFYLLLLLAIRNFFLEDAWSAGLIDKNTSWSGWFALLAFGPTTILYVFGRTITDLLACSQLSRDVFFQNLTFRWTVVDIVSDVLILVGAFVAAIATSEARSENWYYSFQSVVLGSIWLKAFGFMQNLNPKLSVYVISSFEILRDAWQFLLILTVLILGFGDMFFAGYSSFRDDPEKCPDFGDSDVAQRVAGRVVSPFCSGSQGDAYMTVYRLLVGEAAISDFNANNFTSLLFVACSFFGVILLLNLLIAVVVESYERALDRSQGLFGRTRVAFVAKSILTETGIDAPGYIGASIRLIMKTCTFLILVYVALVSTVYFWGENTTGEWTRSVRVAITVASVSYFLLLYQAILVLQRRKCLRKENIFARLIQFIFGVVFSLPAAWVTRRLLGISHKNPSMPVAPDGSFVVGDVQKSRAILRCEKRIQQLEEELHLQNDGYQRLLVELEAMEARLCGT